MSVSKSIIRGYAIRLKPTAEQRAALDPLGHWTRTLYNTCLGRLVRRYESWRESTTWEPDFTDKAPSINQITCIEMATDIAREWNCGLHSQVVQQIGLHVCIAYENFFKGRAAFPAFKRKKDGWSMSFPQVKADHIRCRDIRIPGIGWVATNHAYDMSRITGRDVNGKPIPGITPKSMTVRSWLRPHRPVSRSAWTVVFATRRTCPMAMYFRPRSPHHPRCAVSASGIGV